MIARDVAGAAGRRHDLLVVGGGIQGVAVAFEAARRGLSPLLVERGDFGGATTWNSLRIVHGGLRALQRLDLPRFRESVRERSWWLRHFPDLVEPLGCLMPLHGGLRRPSVLRLALAAEDALSRDRNAGLRRDRRLPRGEVLGPEATVDLFPQVDVEGLRGGALWWDAAVPDSQRLLIELLRWARACGARALNYVEATDLLCEGDRVAGLRAVDRETGAGHELRAPLVVNAAGPWCRALAARLDRDRPALFRPSLAFNLFLDREPPSRHALAATPRHTLAATPRRLGGRTYFLHPWKGGILAGTFHAPCSGPVDDRPPPEALVVDFLRELGAAVPGLAPGLRDVLRVHWGHLPVVREHTVRLATRPVVLDHGTAGGPRGLYSVSPVKLGTARAVALRLLRRLERTGRIRLGEPAPTGRPRGRDIPRLSELESLLRDDPAAARRVLDALVREEAVVHLDDLLLRRTDWGADPREGEAIARRLEPLLDAPSR